MNIVANSLTIALEAHSEQVYKSNKPYILHSIRVMINMDKAFSGYDTAIPFTNSTSGK
jgi:(p)ppGpp synthase/HD superfamily hydrolase